MDGSYVPGRYEAPRAPGPGGPPPWRSAVYGGQTFGPSPGGAGPYAFSHSVPYAVFGGSAPGPFPGSPYCSAGTFPAFSGPFTPGPPSYDPGQVTDYDQEGVGLQRGGLSPGGRGGLTPGGHGAAEPEDERAAQRRQDARWLQRFSRSRLAPSSQRPPIRSTPARWPPEALYLIVRHVRELQACCDTLQGRMLAGEWDEVYRRANRVLRRLWETAPGLLDRAPGLQDRAPGQLDGAPGLQDRVPGLQDGVPGLQDRVPGLLDGVPGLQDRVPGLLDGAPGLLDGAPGLLDGVPGLLDGAPGLQDRVPGLLDGAPGLLDGAPGLQDRVPGLLDGAPGLLDRVPGLQDGAPGLQDRVPGLLDGAPGLLDGAPGLLDGAPGLLDRVPGLQDGVPGLLDGAPGLLLAEACRAARRRTRRLRARSLRLLQRRQAEERRSEREAAVSVWRTKRIHEVEEKKKEKELKLAADSVLCEVRKKQADLKRMQDVLRSLEKLRRLRKEAASRRGIGTEQQCDEEFSLRLEELRSTMKRRTVLYSAEEKALMVMLEGEQEGERRRERDRRVKKETERQLQRRRTADALLFGEESPADYVLQPFMQYYTQAQHSLHALIQIRKDWDVFLVDRPNGSGLPVDWVVPEPPSDETWAWALQPPDPLST